MKVGDKIYKIDSAGKFLRTITHVGKNKIEWDCGYAMKNQIQINPDKKSKVKYIVNYDLKFKESNKQKTKHKKVIVGLKEIYKTYNECCNDKQALRVIKNAIAIIKTASTR